MRGVRPVVVTMDVGAISLCPLHRSVHGRDHDDRCYRPGPTDGDRSMQGTPVSLLEREEIALARIEDRSTSCAEIAERVRRHPTTIMGEVEANGGRVRYRCPRSRRTPCYQTAMPTSSTSVERTRGTPGTGDHRAAPWPVPRSDLGRSGGRRQHRPGARGEHPPSDLRWCARREGDRMPAVSATL